MMCFHPANFGFPRPFYSRVIGRGTRQTDGQTDRQTDTDHYFISPPPYGGRGHTSETKD